MSWEEARKKKGRLHKRTGKCCHLRRAENSGTGSREMRQLYGRLQDKLTPEVSGDFECYSLQLLENSSVAYFTSIRNYTAGIWMDGPAVKIHT